MKFTTKTRYGMRAMAEIADNYGKRSVSVSDIAKKEGISVQYLEQLLNKLKRKGLVKSIRGPKGGYVLARPPAKINAYDIVKVLDGEIELASCVSLLVEAKCGNKHRCPTKFLWNKLNAAIKDVLESATLAGLTKISGGRK